VCVCVCETAVWLFWYCFTRSGVWENNEAKVTSSLLFIQSHSQC
jgi:hypothetical protein